MKINCPTCGTSVCPNEVVFDDMFLVNIDNDETFDEIVTKVGEDRFRHPTELEKYQGFYECYPRIEQARFIEYLINHTDLIIEHDKEHWDNLPEWDAFATE